MSLLYLLLLAIVAVLLQRYSLKHCLDGLHYELQPEKQLVECGEEFQIHTTVTNQKRRPVLYLRLHEFIPRTMKTSLDGTNIRRKVGMEYSVSEHSELSQTVYLMPRQKLRRSLTVSLPARGRYFFRSASLASGDLLGLQERSKQFDFLREIVVMPERADCPELDSAFGSYLGDMSVRRFILSDPILTVGFRDYTGREPQRDISWPATLRRGELMVKQYDYTAEMTATVLLDIIGGTHEEIERCYSLTRSVCEKLESKRIRYSMLTDAPCADAVGGWNYISDGIGARHLSVILEGLGRATYTPTESFELLMQQAEKECTTSRGYVLVTPSLDAEKLAAIRRLESRTGQKVLTVLARAEKQEAAV